MNDKNDVIIIFYYLYNNIFSTYIKDSVYFSDLYKF